MARMVGVALETSLVRAAYRDGGRVVFVEHAWDSLAPERVVDTLSSEIENVQSILLSIGLGFLEVAKPELPAMADADRRRVLLRDADRYFPLEGALAVASGRPGAFAFATDGGQLQRWIRAFEEWAPIRGVIAAPDAIASVISTSGGFVVDAGTDEQGLLQLANGDVRDVRRIPVRVWNAMQENAVAIPSAGSESAPGKYASALGALKLANAPLETMLLDASLEEELRSARTRRQWMSYAFAALALFAIGFAASGRRDATLRATQHTADSLQAIAAPGLAANAQLAQLEEEATILAARSGTASDPLHVLAVISESLPRDAFVQRLEWDGREWRLDGSVNQAATVVPRLDSAHIFANVRVLGASTRFRDGARMRESFSIALQVKGDSVAKR